jgi:hypothetical protein
MTVYVVLTRAVGRKKQKAFHQINLVAAGDPIVDLPRVHYYFVE